MNSNAFRPMSLFSQPFWMTVRYLPRTTAGTEPSAGFTLYRANRDESPKDDVNPALGQQTVAWVIYQSDLDNAKATEAPKVGDVLVQTTGERWTVQKVRDQLQQNVFELETTRERVNQAS